MLTRPGFKANILFLLVKWCGAGIFLTFFWLIATCYTEPLQKALKKPDSGLTLSRPQPVKDSPGMPGKKWSKKHPRTVQDLFDPVDDYPMLSDDEREQAQESDKLERPDIDANKRRDAYRQARKIRGKTLER